MRAPKLPAFVLVALAFASTGAGCKGKSAGVAAHATSGAAAAPPPSSPGVVFITPSPEPSAPHAKRANQYEPSTYMTGSKPDDFPKDIPVYPSSRVVLGGRVPTAVKPTWSLTVETADSKEQVRGFYQSVLTGYSKATDLNMGESALSVWRNADYDLTIMIGKATSGLTTITLDVGEK